MAVDPDFHRPGAVRADLDERGAEPRVPQVEVVHRDPAVLLVEGELRAPGRVGVALAGDEHPLRFLGHPDRRDLRPPGPGRGVQVRLHDLDIAVGSFQRHHRDVVGVGEGGDPAAERVPDLLQARSGRDRVAAMFKELHELAADLQPAEITVQIDTVQALKVQLHVPIQHIIHRDRHQPLAPGRHGNLRDVTYEPRMRLPARKRHAEPGTSAVSGGACLGPPLPCKSATSAAVMTVTRTITVAAGVFAPGHLGELTQQVPFELADSVLEEARARERRLRDLPSRTGLYFVLALGLFPGLGYGRVRQKLTEALDGQPGVPCPPGKALRDLRRRAGIAPVKALSGVLAGPVAQPSVPGVRFGRFRTVSFDGCASIKGPDTKRNRAWLGELKAAPGVTGYPAIELMPLVETGTRALIGAVSGPRTGETGYAGQIGRAHVW